MKNLRSKVSIILVCIILGIILAIQFKTVNLTTGNVIPTQRASQLATELKNIKDEKEKLQNDLSLLESKIKEYEENASEENVIVKSLTKDIERYKMAAGYVDVEGPGVIVVIDDPPAELEYGYGSTIIDGYWLLLELISNLNAAGAEAISINDQRFTNYTEIVPVGNHININGVSFGPHFVVKAIGHTQTLESALNFPGGIIWRMREDWGFDVQIKTEKSIEIPRYTKNKEFIYAKPFNRTSN